MILVLRLVGITMTVLAPPGVALAWVGGMLMGLSLSL
jgi:hypothetical protein